MESNYTQEQQYIKAKKRMKDIKGFYAHLFVNILSVPIIVTVNLMFSPGFHWFWFAVGGIVIATFIHWMVVFGFEKFSLGKDWEEKKIREIMDENRRKENNNGI